MNEYSVKALPKEERPRERLQKLGPEYLSTSELLAVVLGSGTKQTPVLKLANEILCSFNGASGLADATVEEFLEISGVGLSRALKLKAIFGLAKRMGKENICSKECIWNPEQVYALVKDRMEGKKREFVLSLLQNAKGNVIAEEVVSIGSLSQALLHPREVFYPAIRHKASSYILVHNHPSGDPTPSEEDWQVTKKLIELGRMMEVPINDHLIIGHGKYYSFRKKGLAFF